MLLEMPFQTLVLYLANPRLACPDQHISHGIHYTLIESVKHRLTVRQKTTPIKWQINFEMQISGSYASPD